jgi:phosphoglycerate dehydrogenase-like enzyme
MKIAVLDDYQSVALQTADWSRVREIAGIDVFAHPVPVQSAPHVLAGYNVVCLMRERMPFGRELIEQLPGLKLICITGPHNRTLDLQAASERGITVCFTEFNAHSAHATPELAWGLILAALRQIAAEDQGMRHGRWQTTVGTTLHGKTLGLFGLGRIGRRMAEIGTAFGMPVIAWSQNLTDAAAASVGVRRVDKSTLLRESDVLSIHVVLSDRTHNAIGAAELALMKRSAILVNTSRGQIIDERALVEALMEKRIAMAGLDVFCEEPLPPDSPIRKIPNTVLTPHLGFVVDDAYRDFYAQTVENILGFVNGKPVRVLTPATRTTGQN